VSLFAQKVGNGVRLCLTRNESMLVPNQMSKDPFTRRRSASSLSFAAAAFKWQFAQMWLTNGAKFRDETQLCRISCKKKIN